MRKQILLAILAPMISGLALLLSAPLYAATVTVTLDGCVGPSGSAGAASPCDLQVGKDPVFQAFDVSWKLRGSDGKTWTAHLLDINQLSKAVGKEAFEDYLQGFDLVKTCQPFSNDCQLALYALFNPGIETNNGGKNWTPGADAIYDSIEAQTFSASQFPGWHALVPTSGCGADPSCFILPAAATPTPEPASLLLIGSGLILMATQRRLFRPKKN